MAKSKIGGPQAIISGKLGSNVYAPGYNGDGVRIQIVREKAPEVANPRTVSQMTQRMFLATVGAMYKVGREIFDHSFQGYRYGQQNMNRFNKLNLDAIRKDYLANDVRFGYKPYQTQVAIAGSYQISEGSLTPILSETLIITASADNTMKLAILGTGETTADQLFSSLGIRVGGMATGVIFAQKIGNEPTNPESGLFTFIRIKAIKGGSVTLTSANIGEYVQFEAPYQPVVTVATSGIEVTWSLPTVTTTHVIYAGYIHSEYVNGTWQRSTAFLFDGNVTSPNADEALATYPIGTVRVLNGGEVD